MNTVRSKGASQTYLGHEPNLPQHPDMASLCGTPQRFPANSVVLAIQDGHTWEGQEEGYAGASRSTPVSAVVP